MVFTLYRTVDDEFFEKLKNIKIIFCDVDGVLSDGKIYLTNHGDEIKSFFARDGYGLVAVQKCGIKVAVITGRKSVLLEKRMQELGIKDFSQGVTEKIPEMQRMLDKYGIMKEESVYIGDDVIDLPAMKETGLSFCPKDSHPLVISQVDYICNFNGGSGAVREVCDLLLQAKGKLVIPSVRSL